MRYALLVYYDDNAKIGNEERRRRAAGLASVPARLRAGGAHVGGFDGGVRLQPATTATTVRCWDGGDVMVSRGPAATAREQLGGCFVVDCPDEDAAIEAATHIPAAWYGCVEVRQVMAESAQPDVIIPPGRARGRPPVLAAVSRSGG